MQATDLFQWEPSLSPEHRQARDTIRRFVATEYGPKIQKAYRDEVLPEGTPQRLGELGVLGVGLEGPGLPGGDPLTYGLVMRELERGDSGLRSFASVQTALVLFPLLEFGSDAHKEWLPRLAAGTAVGCFGLTESEGGSDPSSMKTRAVLQGDHWELNGSKTWITNGHTADVAIVWAQTVDGIRGFVVPTDLEGVSRVPMTGKLSLRASATSQLFFDKVRLPKEAILPGANSLGAALKCLNQARFGIAWGVLGAAEACLAEALGYLSNREVFGRPLAGFQLVQEKLARSASRLAQAQLVARELAALKARGTLEPFQVSLAKQANVEMALHVSRTCRELLGANGISDEYVTMRHMCNLETVYTYEGTNDIHLLVLGKQLTGLAAFS